MLCLLRILFQQLVVKAVQRQLEAIGDAELIVDLAQVVLDYLLGRSNLIGNLFVAHSASDAPDNGKFFFRELWLHPGVGERGRLSPVGLDHPTNRLVVDPRFTFSNLTHALDEQIRRDRSRNNATDATPVKLDGIGFIGLCDLHDELRIGRLPHQLWNSVDCPSDKLSFEKDHVGWITLKSSVKIRKSLDLSDDTDVILQSEHLLHSHAIDSLRISQDDPDSCLSRAFFRDWFAGPSLVKMNNRHKSGL